MASPVDTLRQMIAECRNAVVFTGAGISTESGIPDFRSPGGIWTRYAPIYYDDFVRSEEARRETWRRKIEADKTMINAEPNRGHMAISSLVARGKVSYVITQNIDGLHQRSGVPAERVIELHGNATYCKCLSCSKRFELEPIMEAFKRDETLPVCDDCGGLVKTATISFGQAMPEEEMLRAQEATLEADLFIALGSSLVVYPAAGFPLMAKENGAGLVIVNRDPTEQDRFADLVIHDSIGTVMGAAVGLNQ